MTNFTRNRILEAFEDAALRLKRARQEKKLSLSQTAKLINISTKYLEAIENNQLNKLPAGLYGKNFIREYALFLGQDPKEVIGLLNFDGVESKSDADSLFVRKVPGAKLFLSFPKIITGCLIFAFVAVCIGYLAFYLQQIIAPPALTITNPIIDQATDNNAIEVQGLTESEAEVMINGELVLTDQAGFFTKKINLKSGLNTISITAQKKYGRKNLVEKKILVKG